MLRALLIITPVVLVTAIACGDSGGDSDSQSPGNQNLAGESSNPGGAENSAAGSSDNPGTGGSHDGGGGTSSTQGGKAGSSNTSAGGTSETSGGAENAGGAEAGAAGAGGSGAVPPTPLCPNLFGTYAVKSRAGACGDFDKNAPQEITGNDVTCAATFVSKPKTGKPAINGTTKIDAKGDFSKAKLTLGSVVHDPCSGNWNTKTGLMTVACGTAADLCTVVLQKQ